MNKHFYLSVSTFVVLLAASPSARAQTVLFKSPPSPDTFQAVFQNGSPSSPKIGTATTTGDGTTISVDTFPGVGGAVPALIANTTTAGQLAQLGIAVLGTVGTGTVRNNPLALGTSSAAANVFNLASGQTFTYSVVVHNNFHGINIISLFNPKAPDAGTSDTTVPTKGGYLGIALTLKTTASDASVSLQGLDSFAANDLAPAIDTTVLTPNGTNAWRLELKLTNNGDGPDTVLGSVYGIQFENGAEVETLSGTLKPETLTLGTTTGTYDLDNSTIGFELGLDQIANLNNKFYMTDISLTSASAAPAGTPSK